MLDKKQLEAGWKGQLLSQFSCDYMRQLNQFLQNEKAQNKVIFPRGSEILNAFTYTPFDQVKVVILGQDPYHGPGQAHGLSFSVQPGVKTPPSLVNIYKELQRDLGIAPPNHGCLIEWAKQGVLLLNSVLTVQAYQAASHQGQGWEQFTDSVIKALNDQREHLVFLLWGGYAQRKGHVIDHNKHLVLTAPHPSPLSAYRGFIGCGHFSRANQYLEQYGLKSINWRLSVQQ